MMSASPPWLSTGVLRDEVFDGQFWELRQSQFRKSLWVKESQEHLALCGLAQDWARVCECPVMIPAVLC